MTLQSSSTYSVRYVKLYDIRSEVPSFDQMSFDKAIRSIHRDQSAAEGYILYIPDNGEYIPYSLGSENFSQVLTRLSGRNIDVHLAGTERSWPVQCPGGFYRTIRLPFRKESLFKLAASFSFQILVRVARQIYECESGQPFQFRIGLSARPIGSGRWYYASPTIYDTAWDVSQYEAFRRIMAKSRENSIFIIRQPVSIFLISSSYLC